MKHGGGGLNSSSEQAAISMLDLFTSVGADSFVVTKTDLLQEVKWGRTYSAGELREKLPAMVRTAARRKPFRIPGGDTVPAGENLIIRPKGRGVAFVQLDDLKEHQLDRIRLDKAVIVEARGPAEPIRSLLLTVDGVRTATITGQDQGIVAFEIQTRGGKEVRETICQRLTAQGWPLRTLELRKGSLEERFVAAVTTENPAQSRREAV